MITSGLKEILKQDIKSTRDLPGGSDGKESACSVGDQVSIPGSGKFPWGRKWQPTTVFLPGASYGWRVLVGYSPWGLKGSDMTSLSKSTNHLKD